jgi:hypothetical protein
MGVKATKGEGDYELMPQDTHIAVCYGVIDLGTQKSEYNGKEKFQHKAMVLFETPECKTEFDGEMVPMVISKEYTLSTDERSNLYKDLMGWRGRELSEDEMNEFDMGVLVGKPCQIQVIHKKSNKGREYARINAVVKFPTGMTPPTSERSPIDYELTPGYIPEDIPDWIKDKIRAAEEWKEADVAEGQGVPDEVSDVEPF